MATARMEWREPDYWLPEGALKELTEDKDIVATLNKMLDMYINDGILSTEGIAYTATVKGIKVRSYNDGFSMSITLTVNDKEIWGLHKYTEREQSQDC